ncbi:hypothetical protein SAMN02745181_1200 [Rubritalea squalenifaciens DSM 18772]|uniref:Uncharacterized protein n=1 Tax=Rubritalea squalenifaciens DSM 18772 TaxID=1123071 RepID=A0A1M6GL87_9BACT|nr:hypothetical protein SAMN02745181_1200 [Rubritalea squalenifaciens DSM 18772]
MNDSREQLIVRLRSEAGKCSAIELVILCQNDMGGVISPSQFIHLFFDAFPHIPLRAIIRATGWKYFRDEGFSDDVFSELLDPWINKQIPFK